MIDPQDKDTRPTLEELAEYVGNPLFPRFCREIKDTYQCREAIEYSRCGLEPGWNVKFKKSGKALFTLYLREGFFTAMVVVGRKEQEAVEAALPQATGRLRAVYQQTRACNGQRWLMLDLEDQDGLYQDVLRLIQIRTGR